MIRIIQFYDRSHTVDNPQYLGNVIIPEEHIEDGYIDNETAKVYYRDEELGDYFMNHRFNETINDWPYKGMAVKGVSHNILKVRVDENKLDNILDAIDLELNPQSSARDIAEDAFEEGYKSEKIKSLIAKIENTHDLDPALAINACNELLDVLKDKYKKFIS